MAMTVDYPSSRVPAPADPPVSPVAQQPIAQPPQRVPPVRIAVYFHPPEGGYFEYYGSYDQIIRWISEILPPLTARKGITVVIRDGGYQRILQEQSLPGIRPDTRTQSDMAWGATGILDVTIIAETRRTNFGVGGFSRGLGAYAQNLLTVTVEISGELLDIETGQVIPVSITASRQEKPENIGIILPSRNFFGMNFGGSVNKTNLPEHLFRIAAEEAAGKLVDVLAQKYRQIPGGSAGETIIFNLAGYPASIGQRFGVFRQAVQVAEIEIVNLSGNQATGRIIWQGSALQPTDVIKPLSESMQLNFSPV